MKTNSSGMTLIEILVVMGLMAFITVAVLSGLGTTNRAQIENTSRELATLIRATFDEASLKGRMTRIAIDIDKNEYWSELGPTEIQLLTAEQIEEERRLDSRRTEAERDSIKKPVFSINKELTKNKKSLPSAVSFTDVLTSQVKEPLEGGVVYAHAFPHGYMEKLTIHIKDNEKREATLIIDPISGKTRLLNSYIREKTR